MIHTLIGQKSQQGQRFLIDGQRIPVTMIRVSDLPVMKIQTKEKNGYWSITVGVGENKKANMAEIGQAKEANLKVAPRFLREIRLEYLDIAEEQLPKVGEIIKLESVLKQGDIVDVIGVSKGKGFAGVVKRHGFKGGPRTHGQSDRERAPGSIGQTTTPGRVYKGKRMAGRMGSDRVTVRNLTVVAVNPDSLLIKGLVPGTKDALLIIKKVGELKVFIPLYVAEEPLVEVIEQSNQEINVVQENIEEEKIEEKIEEVFIENREDKKENA
ncbi:50S ribosomal protein L3 [Candidatus Levyibacteriota bacterium]|nr:50S ribosomal protein L3 [Candidatus Levybacteria bacterium]GDX62353.1 50S ribosomal protein L3 [Candidatus Levybacteria bacterium]